MSDTCYTWSDADIVWNEVDLCWNDVCIALEIDGSAGIATTHLDALNSIEETKRKRFIEIVCKVKTQQGIDHVYEKRKTIKEDIEITSEDVKKTVDLILEVSLVGGQDV